MSFLDKTFCSSPNCNNQCGRKMTEKEKELLSYYKKEGVEVSYGYFCTENGYDIPDFLKSLFKGR